MSCKMKVDLDNLSTFPNQFYGKLIPYLNDLALFDISGAKSQGRLAENVVRRTRNLVSSINTLNQDGLEQRVQHELHLAFLECLNGRTKYCHQRAVRCHIFELQQTLRNLPAFSNLQRNTSKSEQVLTGN